MTLSGESFGEFHEAAFSKGNGSKPIYRSGFSEQVPSEPGASFINPVVEEDFPADIEEPTPQERRQLALRRLSQLADNRDTLAARLDGAGFPEMARRMYDHGRKAIDDQQAIINEIPIDDTNLDEVVAI